MEKSSVAVAFPKLTDSRLLVLVNFIDLEPVVEGDLCSWESFVQRFRRASIKRVLTELDFIFSFFHFEVDVSKHIPIPGFENLFYIF